MVLHIFYLHVEEAGVNSLHILQRMCYFYSRCCLASSRRMKNNLLGLLFKFYFPKISKQGFYQFLAINCVIRDSV